MLRLIKLMLLYIHHCFVCYQLWYFTDNPSNDFTLMENTNWLRYQLKQHVVQFFKWRQWFWYVYVLQYLYNIIACYVTLTWNLRAPDTLKYFQFQRNSINTKLKSYTAEMYSCNFSTCYVSAHFQSSECRIIILFVCSIIVLCFFLIGSGLHGSENSLVLKYGFHS